MAQSHDGSTVAGTELEEGDEVTVYVNNRAAGHLGTQTFDAVVDGESFGDVRLRPVEQLQETHETHTWYSDIGYIHGYHEGLERHSDIGKVRKVERR